MPWKKIPYPLLFFLILVAIFISVIFTQRQLFIRGLATPGGVDCNATNQGISATNNTEIRINVEWYAHYCDTNSSCRCSGGSHTEDLDPGQSISRGFDNDRPSCEWAWQTDVKIRNPEGGVLCERADNGCGSEPCMSPTPSSPPLPTSSPTPLPASCNSMSVSPNPVNPGQNVTFTCNVTPGTGPNIIEGYAFNVQGVRYPTSGWQPLNNINVIPSPVAFENPIWCGAQTIGGSIVGGRNTSCMTTMNINLPPTVTPMPSPVCLVGGRYANYAQTGAGFVITPLSQNLDATRYWKKTWKIAGPVNSPANIDLVSYSCSKKRTQRDDLCQPEEADQTNNHQIVVTIPPAPLITPLIKENKPWSYTTFDVVDEVDCCQLNQTDLMKVNGTIWGSSFFLRWAEAPSCTYSK
jgi:hypothetical protein